MKLRNKILLPFATCATLVATPTLLVSCNQQTTQMTETDIATFDPSTVISQPGQISGTTSIAFSKFYAQRIKEDANVFIKDLLYAEQQNYAYNKAKGEVAKYVVGLSNNIELGEVDYWHAGYHYIYPTVSFTYSWDSDITRKETLNADRTVEYNFCSKQTVTYKNLPLVVAADPADHSKWMISSFPTHAEYFDDLMFLQNWSITSDIDFVEHITSYQGTKIIACSDQVIKTKANINSYLELFQIRKVIGETYGEGADVFYKLFTGSFQFDSKNMDGVTIRI